LQTRRVTRYVTPVQAFITGTDTKRQTGITTTGATTTGAATTGAAKTGATGATTTPVRMKMAALALLSAATANADRTRRSS